MHGFAFFPFRRRDVDRFDDEDCDVSALRRYQQRVLLVGGCLLSVAIIAGMLALVVLHATGFHARRLEALQRTETVIGAELMAADAAHRRLLNMAEYAWRHRPDGDVATQLQERQRYLQGHQRSMVSAGPESAPQMVLGTGTEQWPRSRLDRYLTLAHSLSVIRRFSTGGDAPADATTRYFLDPSGHFAVLGDGLTERGLLASTGVANRAALLQHLQGFAMPAQHARARNGAGADLGRLTLVDHPLTGAPSIAVRLLARDENGPIGSFVVLEPSHRLAQAMVAADPGDAAVVTADGRIVAATGTAADRPLGPVLRSIDSPQEAVRTVAIQRHGPRFYLATALPGTEWRLLGTYCIGDIARDGRRLYVIVAILGGGLLIGLWTLLAWLHRRVFGPALSRAARVYQGEQLSRALIQLSPVGLCLVDRVQGTPVLQNELMRQYAASAERSGIPLYQQLVLRAGELADDAGLQEASEFELRLPANHKDAGRVLLVGAIGATYRGRSVLLCALGDLSARAELEQQQARAREAAEAASLAKGSFLATMSHEIRTPLHGILGHLELLGRSPLNGDQQARLRRINQSADSLLLIINDVLDFSRAEAGQLELEAEAFEPVLLLERVALLFAPLAEAKGLVLDLVVDPALDAYVNGAQGRIEQVLRNLVSNAVKFTPSGRIELRARGGGSAEQPTLLLEVADSGIGLTALQLDRLFQPYVQADASIITRFGGSGLGLSLCRELCRRMGGQIHARSTPGVGSVFSFEVPVAAAERQPRQPLVGHTILLASTVSGWRDELGRRLRGWGAQVQVVEDRDGIERQDLAPGVPLVLFERAATRVQALADEDVRPVVRVRADGPLRPQRRGTGWWVCCYAGDGLLQALLAPTPARSASLAVGQAMD
ncbi:ATP-binding protein [Stenotrophomonas maltophilia]|uniref:ATP-binding protein n=1 Tax=Stenotrophomonas maltophilia TaxID=40324 RepID=UPI0039C40190